MEYDNEMPQSLRDADIKAAQQPPPRYILQYIQAPYSIDFDTKESDFVIRDHSIERPADWKPEHRDIEGDHNVIQRWAKSMTDAKESLAKHVQVQARDKRRDLDRTVEVYDDLGNPIAVTGINANTGHLRGITSIVKVMSAGRIREEKRDAKQVYPRVKWIRDLLALYRELGKREIILRDFLNKLAIDTNRYSSGRISDPVRYNDALARLNADLDKAVQLAAVQDLHEVFMLAMKLTEPLPSGELPGLE